MTRRPFDKELRLRVRRGGAPGPRGARSPWRPGRRLGVPANGPAAQAGKQGKEKRRTARLRGHKVLMFVLFSRQPPPHPPKLVSGARCAHDLAPGHARRKRWRRHFYGLGHGTAAGAGARHNRVEEGGSTGRRPRGQEGKRTATVDRTCHGLPAAEGDRLARRARDAACGKPRDQQRGRRAALLSVLQRHGWCAE